MDLLERMKKMKEEQEQKLKDQEEKKKITPVVKSKKVKITPEIKKESDWDNLTISQDELWFLYRLKFGKGTREKRSVLLPQFKDVFVRNFNEMRK
ncbi:hypothetical protein ES705_26942 [subsurface metagenome]